MSTTRPTGGETGIPGVPGEQRYPNPVVEATRRGAHRARPTPLMAALPALAVVVVVALVAVGVYTLLGGAGGSDGTTAKAGASPTVGMDEGAPSPSAGASPSPTESAQETPQETEEPPAEPDKSISVKVLNNTGTRGLAAKGRTALQNDGWTVSEIGDHKPRGSVAVTTVYYADAAQKPTADAVAAALGASTVEENAQLAGTGITVVLSTDFQP